MRAALHEGAGHEEALLPHVVGGARTPAQRVAVYSSMYLWRLVQALAEDFPVVRRLLGERLFERVAVTHVKRHPSLRLLTLPQGALEVAGGAALGALSPGRVQPVAVWRKGFEVREAPLGPAEAEALRRALAGSEVAAVCEAFADCAEPGPAAIAALVEWVGDGWICGANPSPG